VPHRPHSKEFLASVYSKPTLFQLEAITPCPITTCPCKKSLPSSLVGPFMYWKAAIRSPQSLHFSRLNSPDSFSLSSQESCSTPLIIFVASSEPTATGPCLSCAGGSRAGHRTPGGISPERSRGGRIPSLDLCAGHTPTVGFLSCKRTLPGHVELLINQHPQVLLLGAALSPFSAQHVFVYF